MRTLSGICLSIGLLVLSLSATAQPRPQGGRGGDKSPSGLLQIPSVREHIQLSEDQVAELKTHSQAQQAKQKELFSSLKELPKDEMKAKFTEFMKTTREENEKAMAKILNPEQTKRLKQIWLQQASPLAVNDNADLATSLELTDDQKTKMREIGDEFRKDTQELFRGGNFRENFQKSEALYKETMEKAVEVLTDSQKKKWDDMVGEKFEIRRMRDN